MITYKMLAWISLVMFTLQYLSQKLCQNSHAAPASCAGDAIHPEGSGLVLRLIKL